MNLVDSSAWLSYFAGDKNTSLFAKPIEAIESATGTEHYRNGSI